MLNRSKVIQAMLNLFDRPRYLEVGVHQGETFFELVAARKVAVDVHFAFDVEAAIRANPEAEFHQVPSDAYFGERLEQFSLM